MVSYGFLQSTIRENKIVSENVFFFGRKWQKEQNPSNISQVIYKLLFLFDLSPVTGYSYESSGLSLENSMGLGVLGKQHGWNMLLSLNLKEEND